jgi:hypothetical protein
MTYCTYFRLTPMDRWTSAFLSHPANQLVLLDSIDHAQSLREQLSEWLWQTIVDQHIMHRTIIIRLPNTPAIMDE